MQKGWLVKLIATDGETYSVDMVIAVCTDKAVALELEEKAQLKYSETVFIEEVELNTLID